MKVAAPASRSGATAAVSPSEPLERRDCGWLMIAEGIVGARARQVVAAVWSGWAFHESDLQFFSDVTTALGT